MEIQSGTSETYRGLISKRLSLSTSLDFFEELSHLVLSFHSLFSFTEVNKLNTNLRRPLPCFWHSHGVSFCV